MNKGVFPPLSMLYVATTLNKNGHDCIIIDGNAENLSAKEIIGRLQGGKIDLIGFSAHSLTILQNLPFIREVKEETMAKVFVGGLDAKYFAEQVINYPEIDYVVQGNALDALSLVQALDNNDSLDYVNGLVYKGKNGIVANKFTSRVEEFLAYGKPDWSLLKIKLYHSMFTPGSFATVIASHGCPYKCIYCTEGGFKKVYFRPVKEIISELKQIKSLGINYVEFFDSIFTLNRNWVTELCEEIIKNNLDIKFAMETRVELIDEELISLLKKTGCVRIHYGIESGDDNIQKLIKKNMDMEKIRKAVEITDKYGIAALGYFTLGHPGETKETLNKTLSFAKSLPLTYALFMKIVPYMGTALYDLYVKEKGPYWEDYLRGKNKGKIGHFGNHLSHEFLDQYIDRAYHEFYSRPVQILRVSRHMKSLKQFMKFSKAGLEIIFN